MENFSNNQGLLEFAIISFIVTTLLGEIRCLSIEGIKRLMSMFKKYDRCEAFEDMQWFFFFSGDIQLPNTVVEAMQMQVWQISSVDTKT